MYGRLQLVTAYGDKTRWLGDADPIGELYLHHLPTYPSIEFEYHSLPARQNNPQLYFLDQLSSFVPR